MFAVFMYGFYGRVLCITKHRCEPVDNFGDLMSEKCKADCRRSKDFPYCDGRCEKESD